jgi:hypothetical protein
MYVLTIDFLLLSTVTLTNDRPVLSSERAPHIGQNHNYLTVTNKTVVPKVMSNFFLHATWEQQTKESMVVGETSCCVNLECLVTSIACIT